MHITLLVPELIWPEANDLATLQDIACPQLEKLLARGTMGREPGKSLENTLTALWKAGDNTALADWRLRGEALNHPLPILPAGARWVCADPIHLRFHQERFIIGDGSTFDLTAEEAEALVATLNREFSDIGQFLAPHPQRWYLSLDEKLGLETPPLSSIAGRQLQTEHLSAPQHAWLRRMQNEIQMLLHGHAVNQGREAAGKPVVNGLWLWGSGNSKDTRDTLRPAFDTIWADNPLARGLGKETEAELCPQPTDLESLMAHAGKQRQSVLVVIEDLLRHALYEDGNAWRHALENLERQWFAPLAQALGCGRVQSARILGSGFHGNLEWRLQPGDRWRFWKRPQALALLTLSLAESRAQS